MFGTGGSSGGAATSSADAMLQLLTVMSDPAKASQYLTEIKAGIETYQKLATEVQNGQQKLEADRKANEEAAAMREKEWAARFAAEKAELKALEDEVSRLEASLEKRDVAVQAKEAGLSDRMKNMRELAAKMQEVAR